MNMYWFQTTLNLGSRPCGIHLLTRELVAALPDIARLEMGMLNLFLQHTSAALALNEAVEPEVRLDVEAHLARLVPEQHGLYLHDYEGDDDMPAHIKTILVGAALNIPITRGQLALGTWQGVYLCEFRRNRPMRRLIATIWGQSQDETEQLGGNP
jgi:secondary thiamine-phosphate synthase enzyme